MNSKDEAFTRRYRYEKPALKIVTDIKAHLLPAMEEEEGGWILGLILDLLAQVQLDAATLDAASEMILKVDDMLPQRQAMLSSEAALRAAALDAAPQPQKAEDANADTRGGTREMLGDLQSSASQHGVISTPAPNKDVGAYLGAMADGECFGSDPEHECHEVLSIEHWCTSCFAAEILAWHHADVERYLKLAAAAGTVPPSARCANCDHIEPHTKSTAGGGSNDPYDGCTHPSCSCGFDSRSHSVDYLAVPPSAPAKPQCPACGSDVGALGTEFAYFICGACVGERYWTPDHKHPADSGLSWERGVMCSPWGNARKLLESLKQPVTVTACAAIVAASERTS